MSRVETRDPFHIEPGSWLDRLGREAKALQEQEQAELAELDTPEARLEEWFEEQRELSEALRRRAATRAAQAAPEGTAPPLDPPRREAGADAGVARLQDSIDRQSRLLTRLTDAVDQFTSSGLVRHLLGLSGRGLLRLLVSPVAVLPLRIAAGLLPLSDSEAIAELHRRGLVRELRGRKIVLASELADSLRQREGRRATLRALPREKL